LESSDKEDSEAFIEMVCLPGITTAALFTAVILYDLYDRNWARIPGHGLFGVFATLLILFICERTSEWVAWSLLTIPLVFFFLASFFAYDTPQKRVIPAEPDSLPCCKERPCRRRLYATPTDTPVCPSPPKPPVPACKPKKEEDNCIKNTLA